MAFCMRNNGNIVSFEAPKQRISCQKLNTNLMPSARPCTGCGTCVKTFCTDLCKCTTPCASTPPHAKKTHTYFMLYHTSQVRFVPILPVLNRIFPWCFSCVIMAISCLLKLWNSVYRVKSWTHISCHRPDHAQAAAHASELFAETCASAPHHARAHHHMLEKHTRILCSIMHLKHDFCPFCLF